MNTLCGMLRISLNAGKRLLTTPQCRHFQCSTIGKAGQKGESAGVNDVASSNAIFSDKLKEKSEHEDQGLTPNKPFIVASPTSKCIVGCSCEPESHTINWFYVTEGEPQTCSCGYFFKLDKVDTNSTWIPEYSRIMYVDERRVDPRLQKREGILQKLFNKGKKNVIPPSSMKENVNKTKAGS